MLSEAKHLMVMERNEILRFAQNDRDFVLLAVTRRSNYQEARISP
jgi:hypothetical protein